MHNKRWHNMDYSATIKKETVQQIQDVASNLELLTTLPTLDMSKEVVAAVHND